MGLTKSEEVVKSWLIEEKGFDSKEIFHNSKVTPDFKCGGEEYEAKKIYGNKLIFYKTQMEDISEDTIIVATDLEEVVKVFEWKDRGNIDFNIIIQDNTEFNHTTLSVPKSFAEKIRDFDGENNMERLRNWAESFSSVSKEGLDEDDVREIIRDEVVLEALR